MTTDAIWFSLEDLWQLSRKLSEHERGTYWRWILEQARLSNPEASQDQQWDACLLSLIKEQSTALQGLLHGSANADQSLGEKSHRDSFRQEEKRAFAAGIGLLRFSQNWIEGLRNPSRQEILQQFLADHLMKIGGKLHESLVIEEAKGLERGELLWLGWKLLQWRSGMDEPLPQWWGPVYEQVVRQAAVEWMQASLAHDPSSEKGQQAITRTLRLLQVLATLHDPVPAWIPQHQRQMAQRGIAAILQSDPLSTKKLRKATAWLRLLDPLDSKEEEIACTDADQASTIHQLQQLHERLRFLEMAELVPLGLRLLLQISAVAARGQQLIQHRLWQESQQLFKELTDSIEDKLENTTSGIAEELLREINFNLASIAELCRTFLEEDYLNEHDKRNDDTIEGRAVTKGREYSDILNVLRTILAFLDGHLLLLPAKKVFQQEITSTAHCPWGKLICAALSPDLQSAPEYTRWQRSSALILSNELTAAQILGASLDMCQYLRLEGASRGLQRLLTDNIISTDRLMLLCEERIKLASRDQEEPILLSVDKTTTDTQKTHDSIQLKQDLQANYIKHPSNGDTRERTREFLTRIANPTILIAGMRHSGSTALFNIVRIGFEKANLMCHATYSEFTTEEELKPLPGLRHVIKIHELRDDILASSDIVITTRRDLRNTVASAKRRDFNMLKNSKSVWGYAAYNRSLHESWESLSDYEFVYENFIADPKTIIADILGLIGCSADCCEEVSLAIQKLPTDQYQKTLLSSKHITDPHRVLSYADTLTEEEIKEIERRNILWLRKYGYS